MATAPRSTPCSYCTVTTRLLISNVTLNPQEHLQLCTAVDLQHAAEQAVKFIYRIMLTEGRVSSAPRCRHTCTRERTIETLTPEATPSWKSESSFPPRQGQYRRQHFLRKPHSTQNTFFSCVQAKPCYPDLIILWTQFLRTLFFLDVFTLQLFQNGQPHDPQASFHQPWFSFMWQSLPLLSQGLILNRWH